MTTDYEDDMLIVLGNDGMYGYMFHAASVTIEDVPEDSRSYLSITPRPDYFEEALPKLEEISHLRHLKVQVFSRTAASLSLACVVLNDIDDLSINPGSTLVLAIA